MTVDELTERTIRALTKLTPAQRDVVVTRILESDPAPGGSGGSVQCGATRSRRPWEVWR